MKTNLVRVVKMVVDNEVMFGFEIPKNLIDSMSLVDGEILNGTVDEDGTLHLEKTGVINPEGE